MNSGYMDDNGDLIRISPTSVISVERPGGDAIGNINNNQLHMIYGCVWKWRIDPQDVIKHGFLENIPVLKKTRFPYLDGLFSSGISQLATFDFLRLNIRVDHGLSLTWNIRAKPPPPSYHFSSLRNITPKKIRRNGLTKKIWDFWPCLFEAIEILRPPRGCRSQTQGIPGVGAFTALSSKAEAAVGSAKPGSGSMGCLATGWYYRYFYVYNSIIIPVFKGL